ncbi:hypothetical protein NP493_1611g00026 [Ridgeia piscesae]|uniref:Uncharacterized protein n=1 Tax=Ridgeia piscesae TaxID=27915 RepID=A0AAD9N8Q6_RIDPI|nr:hypothetical protein NP493_1611g00026 [Ridgeia piscesae]
MAARRSPPDLDLLTDVLVGLFHNPVHRSDLRTKPIGAAPKVGLFKAIGDTAVDPSSLCLFAVTVITLEVIAFNYISDDLLAKYRMCRLSRYT